MRFHFPAQQLQSPARDDQIQKSVGTLRLLLILLFQFEVSEIARTKLSNRKVVPLWLLSWWISEGDKKIWSKEKLFFAFQCLAALWWFLIFSHFRLVWYQRQMEFQLFSNFLSQSSEWININEYNNLPFVEGRAEEDGRSGECLQVKWNSNPSTRIDFSYTSSGSF